MARKTKHPQDIKNILDKVIVKIGKTNPGKKEEILKAWQKVVKEDVLGHSRPVGLKKRVLTIEVDSSTWFYNLSLKKRDILTDLKKELSEHCIEDIRFRIGDISG